MLELSAHPADIERFVTLCEPCVRLVRVLSRLMPSRFACTCSVTALQTIVRDSPACYILGPAQGLSALGNRYCLYYLCSDSVCN
eukprot:SAG11_NODE_408_length_9704_cov_6.496774_6_plen_84_part_00